MNLFNKQLLSYLNMFNFKQPHKFHIQILHMKKKLLPIKWQVYLIGIIHRPTRTKREKLVNEYKYSYLTDKAMLLDFPDTFSTIQNPKIFICVNLHYLKHEKSEI